MFAIYHATPLELIVALVILLLVAGIGKLVRFGWTQLRYKMAHRHTKEYKENQKL